MTKNRQIDPYCLRSGVHRNEFSPVLVRISEAYQSEKAHDLRLREAFDSAWKSFLKSSEADQAYINQMQMKEHFLESWSEIFFWHCLEMRNFNPFHRGAGCSDSEIFWRGRRVQFENVSPKTGKRGSEMEVVQHRTLTGEYLAAGNMSELGKAPSVGQGELQWELDLIKARVTQSFVYKAERFGKRIERGLVRPGEHCVIVIDVNQVRKVENFDIAEVGGKALYGVGREFVEWDFEKGTGKRVYVVAKSISRPGKGGIPTDYFLGRKDFSHISAVVMFDSNISDIAVGQEPKFYVFHNFHAQHSLSMKLFAAEKQFYPIRLGQQFGILCKKGR